MVVVGFMSGDIVGHHCRATTGVALFSKSAPRSEMDSAWEQPEEPLDEWVLLDGDSSCSATVVTGKEFSFGFGDTAACGLNLAGIHNKSMMRRDEVLSLAMDLASSIMLLLLLLLLEMGGAFCFSSPC
jgi:hypothetical protein